MDAETVLVALQSVLFWSWSTPPVPIVCDQAQVDICGRVNVELMPGSTPVSIEDAPQLKQSETMLTPLMTTFQ